MLRHRKSLTMHKLLFALVLFLLGVHLPMDAQVSDAAQAAVASRCNDEAFRLRQCGRYDEAQRLYERVLSGDSLTSRVRRFRLGLNYAELLLTRGMYASARAYVETMELPANAELLQERQLTLAEIDAYQGAPDEAERRLRAITSTRLQTEVASTLAVLLYDRGRYQESTDQFDVCLQKLSGRDAMLVRSNRALALAYLGQTERALSELDSCIVFFRHDATELSRCVRKRAEVLLLARRYDAATAAFRSYVDRERRLMSQLFPTMSVQSRLDYWRNRKPLISKPFSLEDHTSADFLFDVALLRRAMALEGHIDVNARTLRQYLRSDEAAVEFVCYVRNDTTRYAAIVATRSGARFVPLFTQAELSGRRLANGVSVGEAVRSSNPTDKNVLYADTALSRIVWQPIVDRLPQCRTLYFAPDGLLHLLAIEHLPQVAKQPLQLRRLTSTARLTDRNNPQSTREKRLLLVGGLDYDDSSACDTLIMPQQANHQAADYLTECMPAGWHFEPLPATRSEVDSIAASVGKAGWRVTCRYDESEERLKDELGGYAAIHLSTHGYALDVADDSQSTLREPEQEDRSLLASGVALTGANRRHTLTSADGGMAGEDGIISARELCDLKLNGVQLTVLSACQTALGRISDEGPAGMVRGLKKAGAQTILASLWQVDDQATSLLMRRFYTLLMQGMSRTNALQSAQQWLRSYQVPKRRFNPARMATTTVTRPDGTPELCTPYDAPYYWAAFVLVDDKISPSYLKVKVKKHE